MMFCRLFLIFLSYCSLKERKLILVFPLDLCWSLILCNKFWKLCQSELVAFTNLKQILFQSTFPAVQGNWKASLKNLLMCFLKLTMATEGASYTNIINFYLSMLISGGWQSPCLLCFNAYEFFSIDYTSLSSPPFPCVNWHFLSSRNLITMYWFSLAS